MTQGWRQRYKGCRHFYRDRQVRAYMAFNKLDTGTIDPSEINAEARRILARINGVDVDLYIKNLNLAEKKFLQEQLLSMNMFEEVDCSYHQLLWLREVSAKID